MSDIIKSKIWRIPLISILTGMIISIISRGSVFLIARGTNEWTLRMGNIIFSIEIILAVVLFLSTGLLCLRDMSKRDILKSALIVVVYYILIVGIEQLLLLSGQYPIILIWLFAPFRLYSVIAQVILRVTGMLVWVGLIPSVVAPFIYVVFGKSKSRL